MGAIAQHRAQGNNSSRRWPQRAISARQGPHPIPEVHRGEGFWREYCMEGKEEQRASHKGRVDGQENGERATVGRAAPVQYHKVPSHGKGTSLRGKFSAGAGAGACRSSVM